MMSSSAISCLQTIKMGFEVNILVCYRNESDLLKLVKITNKILPRLVEKKITLRVCKINRSSSILTTIITITQIMISLASKEKIGRISLGISPMIFSASFCEYNSNLVFQKKNHSMVFSLWYRFWNFRKCKRDRTGKIHFKFRRFYVKNIWVIRKYLNLKYQSMQIVH